MLKKIQRATASSPEGTRGLVRGVLACAAQNIAFMLPTSLLYALVRDLMAGGAAGRTAFYVCGCVACFALILLTTWFQYNGTYFTTYQESGIRRLTLAERLRRLPLSFFGKRDLADLTSTIMADCEVLEKTCSHFIPGLFGSLISTVLIALGLFLFDWAHGAGRAVGHPGICGHRALQLSRAGPRAEQDHGRENDLRRRAFRSISNRSAT